MPQLLLQPLSSRSAHVECCGQRDVEYGISLRERYRRLMEAWPDG